MPEYYVEWKIEIEADSPKEAAKLAMELLLDPDNIASVFSVDGIEIDALEKEEDD